MQWEALEADLLSAGFTLSDIPIRVSWRALMVMARSSQPGSVFHMVTSDEDTQWPRTDQLLALLVDSIRDLTWVTQCVNTDKQPDRPPRLPRPGMTDSEPLGDEPEGEAVEVVADQAMVAAARDGTYGSDAIPATGFKTWWETGRVG